MSISHIKRVTSREEIKTIKVGKLSMRPDLIPHDPRVKVRRQRARLLHPAGGAKLMTKHMQSISEDIVSRIQT
jgi:hypothetical protein